ncbi:citrate-binding protein-like [Phalaenopsis equestris]|uniref:citrate-binding protein-like n=1 Tax=Phalaenopsis equestris TaxID=78828 RepID=UPI0009E1FA2C|nr:citrate-binding protein-like [Phalaenopsis equestris]
MASAVWLLFHTFLLSFSLTTDFLLFCNADPTDGFVPLPLSDENFNIQRPYDVPLVDRYSFVYGVHRMWVYSSDKPFEVGNPTLPRTEIRFMDLDYSSGIWQFEGHTFVPNGTTGTSIMQIHRAKGEKPATELILTVYNGELRFYFDQQVEPNIYNRWVRVNVIHDADANKVSTFINGVKKQEADGKGPSHFYFKCGVYGQVNESNYMESRWRDIKIYKKETYNNGGRL